MRVQVNLESIANKLLAKLQSVKTHIDLRHLAEDQFINEDIRSFMGRTRLTDDAEDTLVNKWAAVLLENVPTDITFYNYQLLPVYITPNVIFSVHIYNPSKESIEFYEPGIFILYGIFYKTKGENANG